jgi:glucosamine-phosphate N-acetyltransferase
MEFREAAPNDLKKGLVDVVNVFTKDTDSLARINTATYLDTFNEICQQGGIIFVCECDGRIVGAVKALIEAKLHNALSKMGHIEDVAVLPSHRNKGIAKRLVAMATDYCMANNCYKVVLDCREDLVPLYTSLGFQPKGVAMTLYKGNPAMH